MVRGVSPRLDLPLALFAWCAGFLWLGHSGSWLLLAVLASACAFRLTLGDASTRRLLTPRARTTGAGLLGAAGMIVGTYALYGPLGALFPRLPETTAQLYRMLRSGAPTPLATLLLIVVVSAAEEIIWRGRFLLAAEEGASLRWPTRAEALRVIGVAAIYGIAHVASGSLTLIAVAFVCGTAWGLLRVATRSLWAPIITHVLWDVTVIFVWPLA